MTRGCIARVSGSGAWYNVVPLPLPAYAPERNPTENLWQYLRGNYLSHEVYENYEAVVNAGRDRVERAHEAARGHFVHRKPGLRTGEY